MKNILCISVLMLTGIISGCGGDDPIISGGGNTIVIQQNAMLWARYNPKISYDSNTGESDTTTIVSFDGLLTAEELPVLHYLKVNDTTYTSHTIIKYVPGHLLFHD